MGRLHRFFSLLAVMLLSFQAAQAAPQLIVGVDASGAVRNAPADWPAEAGPWNGKAARFHAASRKLVFETFREDIRGGSVIAPPGAVKFPGVNRYFVAGPDTGSADVEGTTVLYVANADGSNPYCLGCVHLKDGENGVTIYRALASASDTPATPRIRGTRSQAQQGAPGFLPDGQHLIVQVEMASHPYQDSVRSPGFGRFFNEFAVRARSRLHVREYKIGL
jgi:hypothetical protein